MSSSSPRHHIDPARPDRTATAPYNFVPLPERVLTSREALELRADHPAPWAQHDRAAPGTLSGEIRMALEATTPIYVRGPRRDERDQRPTRLRWEPWLEPAPGGLGQVAVIPGSSWRGWIRTLCEILAFARIGHLVSPSKPFYRTVDNRRVGKEYRARMVRGEERPSGGVARRRPDGSWFIEPRGVVRVWRSDIEEALGRDALRPGGNMEVDLRLGTGETAVEVLPAANGDHPPSGLVRARLVVTGPMQGKRREFAFLGAPGSQPIEIEDRLVERFNDDDQITQFQQTWFKSKRGRPGELGDGDAVFYLLDRSGKLEFFGRAQMFRLPYKRSAAHLLPADHQDRVEPDLVEGVFGRVGSDEAGSDEQDGTIRGRVRFGALRSAGAVSLGNSDIRVPAILSSPKTTTYPHYLTQPGDAHEMTTYLDGDETTIRGFGLYWTPPDGAGLRAFDEPEAARFQRVATEREARELLLPEAQAMRDGAKTKDQAGTAIERRGLSQLTLIQPVPAGTVFEGSLRFDGLRPLELGMLLAALEPWSGMRHRLGAAKPHHLGAMRLHRLDLRLLDFDRRYSSWEDSGWTEPQRDSEESMDRLRAAFGEVVLEHARLTGEQQVASRSGLRAIRRLDALGLLLTPRASIDQLARPMALREFKRRPILPTPHGVVHLHGEPDAVDPSVWEREDGERAPRAARPPDDVRGRGQRGSQPRGRPGRSPRTGAREGRGRSPGRRLEERHAGPPTRTGDRDGPPTGAVVQCTVRKDTTKGGGPRFEIDGYPPTIIGFLHPRAGEGEVPEPGGRITLYVMAGGRNPQLGFPR